MSTLWAAAISSGVGQLIARHSMPTAYATSGLDVMSLWLISRSRFVRNASSTSLGKSSEAGARDAWNDRGTPTGK
eukprot:4205686-Pleurochrysis_carterae.AAC.1